MDNLSKFSIVTSRWASDLVLTRRTAIPMIARAMATEPSTGTVFPLQLAKKNARWRGEIAVDDFERLGDLVTTTGPVRAALRFAPIDRASCRVTGSVELEVEVECQTCLERVPVSLALDMDFRVVRTERDAQTTATFAEPFLLVDESIRVADLIEDDLVLGLPTRGCGSSGPCPRQPPLAYPAAPVDATPGTDGANPFAGLAVLKHHEE